MGNINRREFLASAAAISLLNAAPSKARIGVVQSTHNRLPKPASPEDPLDYERVRDMVWQAIEYSGGLKGRIRAGSWVVIKPNIVFLRPQGGYRSGDITDMRVTKAVLEYAARNSQAGRITIAEGGSYRNLKDPVNDNVVSQGGKRADAAIFDWGTDEFPGFGGSLGGMLQEFKSKFPSKQFDYVDLAYDGVRDASGALRRVEVPRTRRGVGAFAPQPAYFVTNTITKCDFLISVPVMKIHEQCGVTACFKNYVGTAPREAYAAPGQFWNVKLHAEHSLDNRIDTFICDLAAFHPPDFSVVDGIRGLQYTEHNNNQPGQMLRNNLVIAGADPVANDALVARMMGFNPWDIEYLHLAQQREMGSMELRNADVAGDDPTRFQNRWAKPRRWYGRGNREWRVTANPEAPMESWTRYTSPTDTLQLEKIAPGANYAAAVRVQADGPRKAFLWMGLSGRATVLLNGQQVTQEENLTRYRVGQFQKAVELRGGENLLVFRVQASGGPAQLSALLAGPRNDGDSVDGIRWTA